jgi:hypothetical protein
MGAPPNRGYKRSWKNLLLNKGYQLRFTLFMVAISAALMAGLGWWVMKAAEKATTVAMDNVLGVQCQRPETEAAAPVEFADEPIDEDQPAAHVVVDIEEVAVPPPAPPPYPTTAMARWQLCKLHQVSTIERLYQREWRIFWVLIGAGVVLCLGLAVYGIKMTHKVAGPLHKVKLYFAKMKGGKYDKVYNLRKGDQLVDFYEHFKQAHAGVVAMEQADIDRLRAVLAAAEAEGLAGKSPEIDAALAELKTMLARKEKSLE